MVIKFDDYEDLIVFVIKFVEVYPDSSYTELDNALYIDEEPCVEKTVEDSDIPYPY
ncbi:MAG: hypothetical protein WBL95_06985 [Microcoleus sp.]